jgi:hypothetical protein
LTVAGTQSVVPPVSPARRAAGTGWPVRLGQRQWVKVAMWVIVPPAIALLSWHPLGLEPLAGGVDYSWEAALHMAPHDGITFGNNMIFTYGPLGFLSVPTLWYTDTGVIAFFYTVLVRVALAAALFAGARRTYGTLAGALIALVVAGASFAALETVPFFIFSVWVVDRVTERRRLLILMAVGGTVAGLGLLNKLSVGIGITVLTVLMALAAHGRRRDNLLVSLGALVVTVLVMWTVTGQSLGALPAYVHNSARIVSGYAAAMSLQEASANWNYAAGLVAFAFGLAAAVHMTAGGTDRRRWGIVALWIAFCFFEFKEGFVRHAFGQGAYYFIALMGGFLAFRWRRGSRLAGFGLLAALIAFAIAAQQTTIRGILDPGDRATEAVDQLGQVLSTRERTEIISQGRHAIKTMFPIDGATLALLHGHTVHVAPYQAAVAWAYRLHWRPLPVFQSYAAYTTGLDQDDANALNSTRAPERILRNLEPGIDGRVQAFDEGLTTRTILCRYRELRTTSVWQVLGVGPNRCANPVPLATVRANWGQQVPVPAPPNDHTFVFVRIGGVAVGGLERLTAALYKPAMRYIILDGIQHRLVGATASDGLLLRAPAGVDFTAPFNFAPNSNSVGVIKAGQGSGGGLPITFAFFSQSVSAGSRAVPSPGELSRTVRRFLTSRSESPR